MSDRTTTTRLGERTAMPSGVYAGLLRVSLVIGALTAAVHAQTFSAAPVVFSPSGSNSGLSQQVNVKLTAASTIRSITIPLPLAAPPEFFLVDDGGCVEDGTTVNAVGSVCSLSVRFHPAAAGLRTAALMITDGVGKMTAISISGVGYYPQIALIPSAMKIIAGQGPTQNGLHGDGGAAILASMTTPHGVVSDSFGNIYIADTGSNVVRMVDAFGNITTVAGGGTISGSAADGAQATAALLSSPTWLAVDSAGNLFISETGNHVIRRVAMSTSRTISTIAGSYARGFAGDGASASSAKLDTPEGITTDQAGNVYVADSGNLRVRRVDASTGAISTFAGAGTSGFNATSTPVAIAQFSSMSALAIDYNGNLFVADTGNHAVRKISGGNVTVVAGTGASGSSGDGGPATAALLASPAGLALSPAGDVYISDQATATVRKVQASDATIETVAGNSTSSHSFTGVVVPSTSAGLNTPVGIAFDTASNLLVADSANNVVRALAPVPSELNFATQASGTSSTPQTFRIENIGNGLLTLVGAVAANTTTSSNFSLAGVTNAACGTSLPSGAHCSYSITYTPANTTSVSGEFDVTYQASNPNFNSIAPIFVAGGTVNSLTITPSTLPPIVVNTSASSKISTIGATGVPSVDIEGALPPGLAATPGTGTLTLSGVPTQSGFYDLTAFATDALGQTATQAYTLRVLPATVPLTLAETVHAVDALATLSSIPLTLAETIHVNDNSALLLSKSLVLAETVRVTDSASGLLPASINVLEAIRVNDAPNETASALISVLEAIHVGDSANETRSVVLAITEAIHLADAPSETPSAAIAVTEAIHVSDAPSETRAAVLVVTEAIHVADAQSELLPAVLTIAEKIRTNDAPSEIASILLAITEAIHLNDPESNSRSASLVATEAVHLADLINVSLGFAAQTITVLPISGHTYGDASFPISATASSGLPVSLLVLSGPASASGNTLLINGSGMVTLKFTQPGNSTYSAAAPVNVTFNVAPALLTVSANNATRPFATSNPALTFSVTGFVHGDTASVLNGAATLSTTATLNSAAGTYPVAIAQNTLLSPNYSFSLVPGTLTITGSAAQTLNFLQLPDVPLSVGAITLSARSSSGLKITYAVSGVGKLSGSHITLNGTGPISVTASQIGNATYAPATSVTRTFQVTQ